MNDDVNRIDWSNWKPTERAVLCFTINDDKVMLIHKKTGLGKGKINAPGGRIEVGETAKEAAIRETVEETHVNVSDLKETGELFFEFTNGYKLHGTVFFAYKYSGVLTNTIEADPFWCPISEIPYDKMWEDDKFWIPLIFSGKYIKGYFIFDDDKMLSHKIEVL